LLPLSQTFTGEQARVLVVNHFSDLYGFFLSITQSRRTRAGRSFETHVRYLFGRLSYPHDSQRILNGKVDFVLPSEAAFQADRSHCIVFSLKRTTRERWTQVVNELAGTGAGFIFIGTIDPQISGNTFSLAERRNVYFVVPEEVRAAHYNRVERVLNFREFLEDHIKPKFSIWRRRKWIK
jgi:hypothetical protein